MTRTADRLYRYLPFVIAAGMFAWGAARTFDNIDQDAWIYFTYFKQFFDLPFSFQPGNVSYGATSPLHVVVMAPVYYAAGQLWLTTAKAANFLLVFASVVIVHRAARASSFLLPAIVAASLTFDGLFQNTGALFETGVTCFAVALFVLCVSRRQVAAGLAMAGILPLARPELFLVSAVGLLYFAYTEERARILRLAPLAIAPTACYLLYMWLSGAGLLPTSIVGRAIIAREYQVGWLQSMTAMVRDGGTHPYIVFLVLAAVAGWVRRGSLWPAWLVIVPVVGLYLVRPPAIQYLGRYLVPTIPALLFAAAVVIEAACAAVVKSAVTRGVRRVRQILSGAIVVASVAVGWLLLPAGPRFAAYPPDMILQKDLAAAVSGFVRPGDKTLMYEIQGQYFFPGFGVSADGIVGSEAHAFLLRRETFDEFVDRVALKFVVTFNGFNYRPIFKGTPLVDLYTHDLASAVGDEVCLEKHCYRKAVSNPHFSEWYEERPVPGLNVGERLRFYSGSVRPELRGHLIQWNSVYAITRQR